MSKEFYDKGTVKLKNYCYKRKAIKTHFIKRGEPYLNIIRDYVLPIYKEGDTLFVSEKIISISQNRVIEKSSLKVGFWAKFLSKFVMKTPTGYGVGNVYKMQVAIKLAGLPRILFAAFCSAITKPFKVRGVFYKVAGNGINGIDGFYGEAFEEYAELGILNPDSPNEVCNEIEDELGIPTVIVDSNDLGCNVFGKSKKVKLSNEEIKKLLEDNPAGQGSEQTPLILTRIHNH